ncbi:MAG: pyridoxamine 5'-phosphate oxidase family protein [Pirellulales bacterium]|nr:pyridoxamine 5'-phosphate oxidase family protein [Pirellulales bacterium]
MSTDPRHIAKMVELIKATRMAMLITTCADGSLRGRPMATIETDFDGDLWFFTDKDEPKVQEILRHPLVNLSYADPKQQSYVSVSGEAGIVLDRAKIDQLWDPFFQAWFPQGKSDPQIALIKVAVNQAEYWETAPGPVVSLMGFVKAWTTGEAYQPGENEKVEVSA